MRAWFMSVFLLTAVLAVRVKYIDVNKKKLNGNISALDVTDRSFDMKIFWLYFTGYDEGEEQMETVSNLTEVEHIDFYKIGQKMMPIFRNLPKIKHISMKGNKILYLSNGALSGVPVQEVFLDNNKIEVIETWALGPNVNTLYLSCNRLEKFSPRWFQNTSALKEMDLSGNHLESLQGDVFVKFESLSLIVLSHNKIATIGPGAFSNRNTFRILYLDNNQLTELSADMFADGPIKIESIHLQNNRLTFLSDEFIEKTNTTKARISGNPWQCPCYDSIKRWNSWENDNYNKVPAGVPKCLKNPDYEPDCTPVVDFEIIENFEAKIPPRETTEEFCKSYLQ